jgi:hypothetical protein
MAFCFVRQGSLEWVLEGRTRIKEGYPLAQLDERKRFF